MPTYEYRREDGTVFQMRQKMSDSALTTCPDTGMAVERIISGGGGVIYKGSGWYVKDYKNNGTPSKPDSSSSESPKTTASAEKTTPSS